MLLIWNIGPYVLDFSFTLLAVLSTHTVTLVIKVHRKFSLDEVFSHEGELYCTKTSTLF